MEKLISVAENESAPPVHALQIGATMTVCGRPYAPERVSTVAWSKIQQVVRCPRCAELTGESSAWGQF
ncbi:MAG TPA: hypothetical protein VKS82_05370 [Streptosporangiaceae bacterium]|nr:hypothetical protein [Streptosporangiaceae bacterium]